MSAAVTDICQLSDAMVRALLDPARCSEKDFEQAALAGLVTVALRWSDDGAVDDVEGDEVRTEHGDVLVQRATRIASELSDDEELVLSRRDVRGTHRLSSPLQEIRRSLHAKYLIRFDDSTRPYPHARLVLVLRARASTDVG